MEVGGRGVARPPQDQCPPAPPSVPWPQRRAAPPFLCTGSAEVRRRLGCATDRPVKVGPLPRAPTPSPPAGTNARGRPALGAREQGNGAVWGFVMPRASTCAPHRHALQAMPAPRIITTNATLIHSSLTHSSAQSPTHSLTHTNTPAHTHTHKHTHPHTHTHTHTHTA